VTVTFEAGAQLPAQTYHVTRSDLVRYAGAAGDFNPIHWSDRQAVKVGLPGVIAHGMYTMALGARALSTWTGDPASVVEYTVRFTRPVPVPDDDTGAEVVVGGMVRSVDQGNAQVELTVTCNGERVLAAARATVRVTA
jgi:acyl dehydratase